jgi:hypothetical protein
LDIFALPFELVIHFQRTVARNLAMKIQSRQRPCATPNALGRRHPLTGSGFMLTLVRKRNKHRKAAAIPAVDRVIRFRGW